MDNHPIPQDVSHFEFRLIGDMTLRQFGYLAGGIVIGWIFFLLPVFFLIKLALLLGFSLFGAFLAFIPIEGRPSDIMVGNFIRALFAPNQYVYHKTTSTTAPPKIAQAAPFVTLPVQAIPAVPPPPPIPPKETPVIISQTIAEDLPAGRQEKPKEQQVSPQVKELTEELQDAQKKLEEQKETQQPQNTQQQALPVQALEQRLAEIFAQKQELENQLKTLRSQTPQINQQVVRASTATLPKESIRVRKIPKPMSVAVGVPIAQDVPNLIAGVIKDPRGNVLPNILIEVKDQHDNAVRAFKTNTLGQFASATPLTNGTYTVSFEDSGGKNKFETVQIVANGQVILPFEVTSVDAREELRKELFG